MPAAQEPLPDDAPGRRATARARCSRPPTSCCRSPTRWTAAPATPRAARPAAQPAAGWVNDPDPERDYRLNILRLHDEQPRPPARVPGGRARGVGYDPQRALRRRSTRRHADPLRRAATPPTRSRAPASPGVPPLTAVGPRLPRRASSTRRPALHPRRLRQPLRLLPLPPRLRDPLPARRDGQRGGRRRRRLAMQCQSCHGDMSDGRRRRPHRLARASRPARTATPAPRSATAARSATPRRSTTAERARQPADDTFATNPDTPAAGFSLYRFSIGHGGLQCEACHGSTHAEFPVVARQRQRPERSTSRGTPGCSPSAPPATARRRARPAAARTACTRSARAGSTTTKTAAKVTQESCRACHGTDYRGTVLSRSQGDRTLTTDVRHQALLARLPDRLLHLPQRARRASRRARTTRRWWSMPRLPRRRTWRSPFR